MSNMDSNVAIANLNLPSLQGNLHPFCKLQISDYVNPYQRFLLLYLTDSLRVSNLHPESVNLGDSETHSESWTLFVHFGFSSCF